MSSTKKNSAKGPHSFLIQLNSLLVSLDVQLSGFSVAEQILTTFYAYFPQKLIFEAIEIELFGLSNQISYTGLLKRDHIE